jgi:hypothetical protein
MSHLRFTSSLSAAILVAALAACSSGSATSPNSTPVSDQQVSNDVASASAPDVAGDAGDFYAEGQNGSNFGVIALASTSKFGGMSASSTTCGPSTTVMINYYFGRDNQDTISFNRTREWFADGACATSWSPAVDSVEYVGTWDADLADVSGKWSLHGDRVRNSTVMGNPTLDSASSHVWNANALVHDTIQFVGAVNTRHYAGIAYDTATTVTFNHPRNGELYPISGTWTRWATWNLDVTGAVTKTETVERHILVTFNGTEFVPLAVYNVQTGQVALRCQVDLLTHRIVPGSCSSS